MEMEEIEREERGKEGCNGQYPCDLSLLRHHQLVYLSESCWGSGNSSEEQGTHTSRVSEVACIVLDQAWLPAQRTSDHGE